MKQDAAIRSGRFTHKEGAGKPGPGSRQMFGADAIQSRLTLGCSGPGGHVQPCAAGFNLEHGPLADHAAGQQCIAGDPIKVETKAFRGASYRSSGLPICSTPPPFITPI